MCQPNIQAKKQGKRLTFLTIYTYTFKHQPTFAALSGKSPIQQNTSLQFEFTSLCTFKREHKSSPALGPEAENEMQFSLAQGLLATWWQPRPFPI